MSVPKGRPLVVPDMQLRKSSIAGILVLIIAFSGCVGALASPSSSSNEFGNQNKLEALVCNAEFHSIDLQTATILDLQAALEQKKITSVELVEAYYQRILALDDMIIGQKEPFEPTNPFPEDYSRLNSIRVVNTDAWADAAALDAERAAGNVRGPLHGIPVLLKDNIGAAGSNGSIPMATSAGSIALQKNYVEDSTMTAKLREAGAIILGKAELAEFANWMATGTMPNSFSSIGGQVTNAYTGGNPSGSSGGSGVAASMAFSAATVGSETSGSIIGPSSSNSVVGLKPTMGLVSRYGVIPLAASFDMTGPMVRSVTDAAVMLGGMDLDAPDPNDAATKAVVGHEAPDGYLSYLTADALQDVRVGFNPSGFNRSADPPNNYTRALLDVEAQGATLVPITSNHNNAANVYLGTFGVVSQEFKYGINDYLLNVAAPMPDEFPTGLVPNPLRPGHAVQTLEGIIQWNQRNMDRIPYGQQNLIASETQPGDPVTPLLPGQRIIEPALLPGQAVVVASKAAADKIYNDLDVAFIVGNGLGYYGMSTGAGYPSIAVPSGYSGRSPQSITFSGPAFSDGELLGIAYAFEQATQYRERPDARNLSLLSGVCPFENGGKGAGKAETTLPVMDPRDPVGVDAHNLI